MNLFKTWLYYPAEWYEFWFPQSGFVGGILAFIFIINVVMLLRR